MRLRFSQDGAQDAASGRTGLRGQNVAPMINVVFLLLIFLLMVAQLSAPAPVAVTLPRAQASAGPPADVELFLDARGEAAFADLRGAAAVARVARMAGPGATLTIRADAAAEAADLAALLPRLTGFARVALATAPE